MKLCTVVWNPKSEIEFVMGQNLTTLSPIPPICHLRNAFSMAGWRPNTRPHSDWPGLCTNYGACLIDGQETCFDCMEDVFNMQTVDLSISALRTASTHADCTLVHCYYQPAMSNTLANLPADTQAWLTVNCVCDKKINKLSSLQVQQRSKDDLTFQD